MNSRIRFPLLAALLAVLCALPGCGDRRTVSQLPDTHSESWMDVASPDFHGGVALANGTSSCAICHGDDFLGGKVSVSCVECHTSSGACTTCHGGLDNISGAPPFGLRGEVDDTTLAVGAHTAHLEGTASSRAVPCDFCHLVPATMLEPSHFDTGNPSAPLDSIAEINWQGFADGGAAAWDRVTHTCSDTYCHGGFEGGDRSNAPDWTATDQALCGSCHDTGDSPELLSSIHSLHLADTALVCSDCHSLTVDAGLAILNPDLHVNGSVEVLTTDIETCDKCHGSTPEACTYCHGGVDNLTGAPPRGLHGETVASERAVGAHTTHMEGSYVSDPFACSECHRVPTQLTDPGHFELDSTAEITWGDLAGASSQWNRTTNECSDVYCHGNFSGGYAGNTPVWTAPGQAACGSCHDDGSSPRDLSGRHYDHVVERNLDCNECHATTVNAALSIIDKTVHVDGNKTVAFAQGVGTYVNGTCSNVDCHGNENW